MVLSLPGPLLLFASDQPNLGLGVRLEGRTQHALLHLAGEGSQQQGDWKVFADFDRGSEVHCAVDYAADEGFAVAEFATAAWLGPIESSSTFWVSNDGWNYGKVYSLSSNREGLLSHTSNFCIEERKTCNTAQTSM